MMAMMMYCCRRRRLGQGLVEVGLLRRQRDGVLPRRRRGHGSRRTTADQPTNQAEGDAGYPNREREEREEP